MGIRPTLPQGPDALVRRMPRQCRCDLGPLNGVRINGAEDDLERRGGNCLLVAMPVVHRYQRLGGAKPEATTLSRDAAVLRPCSVRNDCSLVSQPRQRPHANRGSGESVICKQPITYSDAGIAAVAPWQVPADF